MQIDGLELIRKMQNNEIEENTKIKVYRIDENFNSVIHEVAELTYFQNQTLWTGNSFRLSMLYDKKHVFEIVEEEKEIEKLTLKGKEIGYGVMSEWLDFTPNNNEQKICSAIESIGIKVNELVREVKKLKKEGK